MELFQNSPIVGNGYYIFKYLGFKLGDTHNVWIKILAEQGIVGITAMFVLFVIAIRQSWRLFYRAREGLLRGLGVGFIGCTFAVIVGNFFGDRWTHFPLGAWWWVFLGLVERGNYLVAHEGDGAAAGKVDKPGPKGPVEVEKTANSKPRSSGGRPRFAPR